MDLILEKAKRFTDNYFHNPQRHEEILNRVKEIVSEIDSPMDRIKFINFVLSRNNADYEAHKPVCRNPDTCQINYGHENIAYYLTQELSRLGVNFDDDTFSSDEKKSAESKLDQILHEISALKLGQQIIYDDLIKELNELRELYFLGKKKWYQLVVGKAVEMTASGVVSETISKKIIDEVKNLINPLLPG